MDFAVLRRWSLKIFLGFLGFTGLVASVSVLTGSFGDFQLKILATSFSISGASICAMSCAAFIERKRRVALGLSGIILSIIAALMLIVGLWLEVNENVYWKFSFTLVVAAFAFGHAFLLVLPELDSGYRWVQRVSTISIGFLSAQIVFAMWAEIGEEMYYRFLAVVVILVALVTLAIPMLLKMRKGDGLVRERLILEQVEGDVFQDEDGKKYRVAEIDSE